MVRCALDIVGDILDYDLFKYGEGKRHKDRYYGESIYSSFQLEKSDGRFFFVQDKSDEAIMVTGLCDGFIIANLENGKNQHQKLALISKM